MNRSFKWLFPVLIGCFAIGYVSATTLSAGTLASTIVVQEANYNFGELAETAPLSHDFIVKNGGNAPLNISDVRPS